MKENYHLPLTKREAKQLMEYLYIREDHLDLPTPNKKYWERHEKLASKLQVIIYSANDPSNKIQKN